MNTITAESLVRNGFVETTYPHEGQEIFYTKALRASAMPRLMEQHVDNETIFPDHEIVVEVCPDWTVQWIDQSSDNFEAGIPVQSEEGLALLVDAGFDAHAPG